MRGKPSSEPPPSSYGNHGGQHHPKPRLPPILIKDNDSGSSIDGTELMTPRTKKRVTLNDEPIISGPAYAFFPTPSPRHQPPMTRPRSSSHPAPAPAPPAPAPPTRKGKQKPPPPNISLLSVSWNQNQKQAAPPAPAARPTSHSAPPPPRQPPPPTPPSSHHHPVPPVAEPSPRSALKKTPSNFSQRSFSSPPAVMSISPITSPSYPPPRPPPPSPRGSVGLRGGNNNNSNANAAGATAAAGGGGGGRHVHTASPTLTPSPNTAAALGPLHEGEEGEEDSEFESSSDEDEEDRMGSRHLPLPPRRTHFQPAQPPAVLPSRSSFSFSSASFSLPPRSSFSPSSSSPSSSSSSPRAQPTRHHQQRPQQQQQQQQHQPHGLPFGGRAGGRTAREEARDFEATEEGRKTQEEINREAPSPRRSSSSGASSWAAATAAVQAAQRQQQRVIARREAEHDRERVPRHLSLPMPPTPTSPTSPSSSISSASLSPSLSLSTAGTAGTTRPPPPSHAHTHTQARHTTRCQSLPQAQIDVKNAIRRHLALGPFTSGLEWTMLACVGCTLLCIASMTAESGGFFVGYNDFAYSTAGSLNLIDMHIGWNRFSMDVNGLEAITTRFLDNVSQLSYILGCLTFAAHFLCVGLCLATFGYLYNLRTHGRLSPLGGVYTHTRWLAWLQILLGLILAGVGCVGFPWFVQQDFMAEFRDAPQIEGFQIKVGWAYALSVTVAALCLIMGIRLLGGSEKMDTVIARGAGRTRGGRRLRDVVREGQERKREEMRRGGGGRGARPPPPPRPAFLSSV